MVIATESGWNSLKVIFTEQFLAKVAIFRCFDVCSVRPPQIFQVQAKISTVWPVFPDYISVLYDTSGKNFEFFLLNTLETAFWTRILSHKWSQLGHIFKNKGTIYNFQERVGETSFPYYFRVALCRRQQSRIHNPVEHLRWSFQQLTVFANNSISGFDWVLNMPLNTMLF